MKDQLAWWIQRKRRIKKKDMCWLNKFCRNDGETEKENSPTPYISL